MGFMRIEQVFEEGEWRWSRGLHPVCGKCCRLKVQGNTALSPKPETRNPKPETRNPKPCPLSPTPKCPAPQP